MNFFFLLTKIKKVKKLLSVLTMIVLMVNHNMALGQATISESFHGLVNQEDSVSLYKLENKSGASVQICAYGGTVISIRVPDRQGIMEDVVIGFDTLEDLIEKNESYFGVLVGRYANRIGNGSFELDGVKYPLSKNNGNNHLHGGTEDPLNKVVWNSHIIALESGPVLRLNYSSRDTESGYPGNVQIQVDYSWTEDNQLIIEYQATSDKNTFLNLTNHTYFNLSGIGAGMDSMDDVLNHEILLIQLTIRLSTKN